MPYATLKIINRVTLSFFLIVLVDVVFLGGAVKSWLPVSVADITWYYFFFGLPHILASYSAYFSASYFSYYKKWIYRGVVINAALIIFLTTISPKLCIYFFILYTMYHVASQQLGLAKRYVAGQSLASLWKISGLMAVITLGFSVGGELYMAIAEPMYSFLQTAGCISTVLFFILGMYLYNKHEYVLTTTLIFSCAALSLLCGYPLIGILMIRFAHDISAFTLYIQHDKLFQTKHSENILYRFLKIPPQAIIVALPLLSVCVAVILQVHANGLIYFIILLLSLTHYYLEGHVWKQGTPHRAVL